MHVVKHSYYWDIESLYLAMLIRLLAFSIDVKCFTLGWSVYETQPKYSTNIPLKVGFMDRNTSHCLWNELSFCMHWFKRRRLTLVTWCMKYDQIIHMARRSDDDDRNIIFPIFLYQIVILHCRVPTNTWDEDLICSSERTWLVPDEAKDTTATNVVFLHHEVDQVIRLLQLIQSYILGTFSIYSTLQQTCCLKFLS